jgi:hypothetical protein
MAYKLLGKVVWKSALWYLRRRYPHLVPRRRVVLAGAVGAIVAAIYAANRR